MDFNDKITVGDFHTVEPCDDAVTMRNMDEGPHTRLKHARKAAGYRTAKEFSDRNGFKQSTYSTHEKGTRPLTLDTAQEYGPLLDTSPSWLLFGGDSVSSDLGALPDLLGPQVGADDSSGAPAPPETGIPDLDEICRRIQATLTRFVDLANRGSFASAVDMVGHLQEQAAVAKAHCVIAADKERERAADFIEKHSNAS